MQRYLGVIGYRGGEGWVVGDGSGRGEWVETRRGEQRKSRERLGITFVL